MLEIEIKETKMTGDVLNTVNETIKDYLQTLSINYDYQLTVDLINNENGAILSIDVVIIATDDIAINGKDIIDKTQSVLTNEFVTTTTTTEAVPNSESPKNDYMLYIYIIISCVCTVVLIALLKFCKTRKRKMVKIKSIELAISSTASTDNTENDTENDTENANNANNTDNAEIGNHTIPTSKANIDGIGFENDNSEEDEVLYSNMSVVTTPKTPKGNNFGARNEGNDDSDHDAIYENVEGTARPHMTVGNQHNNSDDIATKGATTIGQDM